MFSTKQQGTNLICLLIGIAPAQIERVPYPDQRQSGWLRPVFAGAMALVLLLLGLAAANERVHSCFHPHGTASHVACAICAFAQGQVDFADVSQSAAVSLLSLAWTVPALESALFPAPNFCATLSRGPPASFSSL